MKGESVHKRVAKLEQQRGGVCFMALMGEVNRPENVEKLKQKIIARGQKPYFLHMYFGGQAEKDSYENNSKNLSQGNKTNALKKQARNRDNGEI